MLDTSRRGGLTHQPLTQLSRARPLAGRDVGVERGHDALIKSRRRRPDHLEVRPVVRPHRAQPLREHPRAVTPAGAADRPRLADQGREVVEQSAILIEATGGQSHQTSRMIILPEGLATARADKSGGGWRITEPPAIGRVAGTPAANPHRTSSMEAIEDAENGAPRSLTKVQPLKLGSNITQRALSALRAAAEQKRQFPG